MAKVVIASDHGGFKLKGELTAALRDRGHAVDDLGTDSPESCDYPDYANNVARRILEGPDLKGILICGSGVGMSIAANRHKGIRAVVCSDVYTARISRAHTDTNILCLGERVVGPGLAWEIVSTWLAEGASNETRHTSRRHQLDR